MRASANPRSPGVASSSTEGVWVELQQPCGRFGAHLFWGRLRGALIAPLVGFGGLLLCLWPLPVLAAESCRPVAYADGDTFTFMRGVDQVRVRVAGFDAPERGQPFGHAATQRLQILIQAGAMCDCYKTDRYGRSVCTVRTQGGENVAALMLRVGLGCIDPRFEGEASVTDRQAAREALRQAQAQRIGMWSQSNPVCAVEYRIARRDGK
jgi:endonuclease YncB( thermonuclease family)